MINWTNVQSRIAQIAERIKEQNFCIDIATILYQKFIPALSHRNDLNLPVISAYWSKQILDHHKLNDFDINPDAVLIEENYYSYLNITELVASNARTGNITYIVDYITDSTDLKEGEDLDEWMTANDFFQDTLKDIWTNKVAAEWIKEGRLITRKKKSIKLEDYWNYEDYIYTIRVWDQELNIWIIFLLGTYDNYL
jgi:hypothetical protein